MAVQSPPSPLFPGFQSLGKSSHFMSTVLQNRNLNKFQHEQKALNISIFTRLDELVGRVFLPVHYRAPPDQKNKKKKLLMMDS